MILQSKHKDGWSIAPLHECIFMLIYVPHLRIELVCGLYVLNKAMNIIRVMSHTTGILYMYDKTGTFLVQSKQCAGNMEATDMLLYL